MSVWSTLSVLYEENIFVHFFSNFGKYFSNFAKYFSNFISFSHFLSICIVQYYIFSSHYSFFLFHFHLIIGLGKGKKCKFPWQWAKLFDPDPRLLTIDQRIHEAFAELMSMFVFDHQQKEQCQIAIKVNDKSPATR